MGNENRVGLRIRRTGPSDPQDQKPPSVGLQVLTTTHPWFMKTTPGRSTKFFVLDFERGGCQQLQPCLFDVFG